MNVFTVFMKNQPGELADLSEAIADRGVSMMLCAVTLGSNGIVALVADDEGAVRAALEDLRIEYSERTAFRLRLEDRSGQAAMVARRLSDAGVNMELLLPVSICEGQAELALCVSDDAVAQSVLGDLVVA
jgi:hypothetical protein